jgi:hypothetical protein
LVFPINLNYNSGQLFERGPESQQSVSSKNPSFSFPHISSRRQDGSIIYLGFPPYGSQP